MCTDIRHAIRRVKSPWRREYLFGGTREPTAFPTVRLKGCWITNLFLGQYRFSAHVMFLGIYNVFIFLDGSHMQCWTLAHSLSTFRPSLRPSSKKAEGQCAAHWSWGRPQRRPKCRQRVCWHVQHFMWDLANKNIIDTEEHYAGIEAVRSERQTWKKKEQWKQWDEQKSFWALECFN